MYSINFQIYDNKEEELGGDYWKFLDATLEELQECGIYFFDFMRVWNGLKNEELKIKIKEKLISLVKQKGLFYNGMSAIEASVVFFGIVRAADHTLAAVVLVYDKQSLYSVIVIYLVADCVIVLGKFRSRAI